MNDNIASKPIGIFDSGIGGLTVFKEVRREMPSEDIVYFGDTAHVPYGTKSKETITKFSIDNVHFLQTFDAKCVIVACNTASSLALDALRAKFSMPVIGVIEPGARAALRATRSGRIGVIGTKSTVGSSAYEQTLKKMDERVQIYSSACPLFVPFVEEGWLEGAVVEAVAKTYLEHLKSLKIDTLILGCTHYPLLTGVIQKIMGSGVVLVNSAEETAKETRNLLKKMDLRHEELSRGADTRFYVSDEPEGFRILGERFLGCPIPVVSKVAEHFKHPDFDRRQADALPKSGYEAALLEDV